MIKPKSQTFPSESKLAYPWVLCQRSPRGGPWIRIDAYAHLSHAQVAAGGVANKSDWLIAVFRINEEPVWIANDKT